MSEWREPLLREGIEQWAMRRAVVEGVKLVAGATAGFVGAVMQGAQACVALAQTLTALWEEWCGQEVKDWERAVMAFEAGAPCDVRAL